MLVVPLTGCADLTENWMSMDRHTFPSTPLLPATITLVDTTTDEEFWRMEVPVCTRLRLDFDHPPEMIPIRANANPATVLNWALLPQTGNSPIDSGQCHLNGCRPFLIKVIYRKSPELPASDPGMLVNCPGCEDPAHQQQHQVTFAPPGNSPGSAPAPGNTPGAAPAAPATAQASANGQTPQYRGASSIAYQPGSTPGMAPAAAPAPAMRSVEVIEAPAGYQGTVAAYR